VSEYNVSKSFRWQGEVSDKVRKVIRMFGLTVDRLRNDLQVYSCNLKINAGDVVYITGPSGAGKSVLLRQLQESIPKEQSINLADIDLSEVESVIDCMDGDLQEGLKVLSKAGLSDVFTIINKPARLSEGQKYRFRLAKALSSNKKYIFADEFCSNLDAITASVISYNIRKIANQSKVTFILAGNDENILYDLQPDVIVTKHPACASEVTYQ
jgi:hypothetical protein